MKKIVTVFLAMALVLSSLTCLLPRETALAATAEEVCGHLADGSNVEAQD